MGKKETVFSAQAAMEYWQTTSDSGDFNQLSDQKPNNGRRKRFEVRRLKHDDNDSDDTKANDSLTEIYLSFSSSPASASSDHSSENDVIKTEISGFGDETRKKSDDSQTFTWFTYGSVSLIGRRRLMEDTVTVQLEFLTLIEEMNYVNYDFFAVFDGHGGSRVAEACRDRLNYIVAKEAEEMAAAVMIERKGGGVDWDEVMVASFGKMDEEVNGRVSMNTMGSTAVVAVVGKEKVVVANCGDSRAVLCRGGVAVALSCDHKPDRPDELERVEAEGGRVINWNGHRILGVLATSRSIGDHYLKPFVTSKPEVTIIERTDSDEFMILASDGLWDVVSNEVACRVVRRCLDGRMRRKCQETLHEKRSDESLNDSRAAEAAAVLAEMAMGRGSKDNISVIVVELRRRNSFFC